MFPLCLVQRFLCEVFETDIENVDALTIMSRKKKAHPGVCTDVRCCRYIRLFILSASSLHSYSLFNVTTSACVKCHIDNKMPLFTVVSHKARTDDNDHILNCTQLLIINACLFLKRSTL